MLGTAFGFTNTLWFIGALLGPVLTGWIKDVTGSFAWGFYLAAIGTAVGALVAFSLRPAFRVKAVPSVAGHEERRL
ncbi:MAG: hypothetical protein ACE5JD_05120 [Candidatus Methylomirabilia bacterium]